MNILVYMENRTQIFKLGFGLILVCAIGILDLLTGYELSFSIVYVIPISLTTWIADKRFGILVSFASALVWYIADLISGHTYSSHFIPVWNTIIRLSFFVIISMLLSRIKSAMEKEIEYARTDGLTGAFNSRFFYELVGMEIVRLQRYGHPFTLVYFDLDNFKSVNDRFGHITGDQVLRNVVSCIKTNLRKTDVIARVGGDEFALLLPETGAEAAHRVMPELEKRLVASMQKQGWPITFSMGVMTFLTAPPSLDELFKLADELMYAAKKEGKNAIHYGTYKD